MQRQIFTIMIATLSALGLTACGGEKTASSVFEKTTDECLGDALSDQFIVRHQDGRTEVVRAASKEAFLEGYVSQNLDSIEYAEHDYHIRMATKPSLHDSQTPGPTADNWGVIRAAPDSLWQEGVRGEDVIVAVVDSGLDITHPQLRTRVAVNAGESGLDDDGQDRAFNRKDDDGNGFIDDVYGYDFVDNRGLHKDHQYHGTHVAGIIAAEHTDIQAQAADYVQGLAPAAKILPLAFLDATGSGLMSNGVSAIKYAADRGARVINASWGGTTCSRSLRDVIASLESRNIAFVAAAGNEKANVDRFKQYPASLVLPAQITVGAVGLLDYMADYSNYGTESVHIFAPGTHIISTVPGGQMLKSSGTSMAAPFVAGALALLISAEPDANLAQLRHALSASAFKRSEYLNATQGRLDLATALTELREILNP